MSTVTGTTANRRLRALSEAGVSVWLDQISRSLIAGGELARLVAEQSLRGVTSNPAIFEKSILGGTSMETNPSVPPDSAWTRASTSAAPCTSATAITS